MEVNPGAFEPDLAAALGNLGIRLSKLGRPEEALEAATEAVQLYRQLAENGPDTFQPDLAMALNNLMGLHQLAGRCGRVVFLSRRWVST
jgi:tetratricopeptide (TPR) repeat protein